MATLRMEGAPVAEAALEEARARIQSAPPGTPVPTLASVHRPQTGPFQFYLRRQAKAAEALGLRFRDECLEESDGARELVERMRILAHDSSVHAVLLEHPLPPPFDFRQAASELPPEKDVDGVSPHSLGLLLAGHPIHVPAVARAALRIARHYRLPIEGQRVAVVGRSETVGLPLALLLLRRGTDATVVVAHSRTPDLGLALRAAKVVFSCVGHPGLLNRTTLPEGAAVVDVGLSSRPDPQRPGRERPFGDADAIALEGWASALTPVPGGVGPVTVSELMGNAVWAWQLQVVKSR